MNDSAMIVLATSAAMNDSAMIVLATSVVVNDSAMIVLAIRAVMNDWTALVLATSAVMSGTRAIVDDRSAVVSGTSLDADVESMGLAWHDRGGGYWQLTGGLFTLHVVEIDVVGPAEGDDLLYSLGHGALSTPEARWFWLELVGSKEAAMSMQDLEGYDELMQKLLDTLPPEQVLSHYGPDQRLAGLAPEQRLAGLAPEQRLAGLAPEQRLAGLAPEQRLAGLAADQRLAGLDRDHQALALPIEVVRLLPEAYLCSLAPDVQAELRRRLKQNGH
jgi:hypothetical protein